MIKWLAITIMIAWGYSTHAQFSNKKEKWITRFGEQIRLDSLSIDPGSIQTTPQVEFAFDVNKNTVVIPAVLPFDSVKITYRVFPFNLSAPHATHTLQEYDSTIATAPTIITSDFYPSQREELFTVSGIQKSGSISRGVSFGSNQDVFVNSTLNLQMDGKLSDDLNIRAVITDQNIPFEPEGNTQQLQDFDNVFIQLYNDKFDLTAGDIVLKNKESVFLRYYKNVQGGQANVKYYLSDKLSAESSAAISVAKGKFASIQVTPNEGVSGPYKLRGPNGERFIIVLANSEKVYLDGKLLERGFNRDYVIDYNLAELTFTNKIVVTRFSRIRVDFEFSDRNYNRSILQTDHYFTAGRADFHVNFYREKDNRNQPLSFDLTDADKRALSLIGDDVNQALISGADSVAFNENLVMYKGIDTLDTSGRSVPIFKHSTSPDSARFIVYFTDVGQGNGDYQLLNSNANGRIYQWVSPVNGLSQGRYAPVNQVVTPSMKQMFTLGGGYRLSETDRIYSELALSDQDINLYSAIGNEDNQGYALKIGYEKSPVPVRSLRGYLLSGTLNYEHDDRNFRAIDRFRNIEFNRNWGVSNGSLISASDRIFDGSLRLSKDENNGINYTFSGRKRGRVVDGWQHDITTSKNLGKLQLNNDFFFLNNDQSVQQNQWKRWRSEYYLNFDKFQPGYQYTTDRNSVVSNSSDSVINTAMNFAEHLVFLRSGDSLKTHFNFNYAFRRDRLPIDGELMDNNQSHTFNALVGSEIGQNQDIDFSLTYRNLENLNAVEDDEKHEETIMGRIDWTGSFVDDHLNSELTYATTNSRELRREFIFLQVNTGEGTHTWRDLNNDGVQDISEFFEAINPDERNYVKIFVPTDDFIQAFSNLLNYRLSARMPRAWQSQGGIKSLLGKLSNVTSVNLDKKVTDEDLAARFIPFSGGIQDEDIIAVRQSIRSTFFFNRANPGYAMDFGVNLAEGKQLLTNGIESRENNEYNLNLRYNLNRHYNMTIKLHKGRKSNFSDFLSGRNYLINIQRIGPEFSWQPSGRFRLTTGYIHTAKQNIFTENQGEGLSSHEMRTDIRVAKAGSSSFNATFRYIINSFEGDENSALGYELLDALRPGKNTTWNFNFQRKLANGLRLSMNYEGRKSVDQAVIHIGRMQVTALF